MNGKILNAAIVALMAFTGLAASAHGQTRFQALAISDPKTLELAPDPRFSAPEQGTVEMWLALAEQQPGDPDGARRLCIVEHGTAERLNWRLELVIDDAGERLVFGRPDAEATVEMSGSFRGQGYVHLAFVTVGGRTSIIADGKRSEGFALNRLPEHAPFAPYRPAHPEGLPLTFGCAQGPTALGWMSAFRIWNRPLFSGDLDYTKATLGAPRDRTETDRHLLAYALFTDEKKEVRFTRSRLFFTPLLGRPSGTPFLYRRPSGQTLRALHFRVFGQQRLGNMTVEWDVPSRGADLTDGRTGGALSIPTFAPISSFYPELQDAAYLLRVYEAQRRAGESPASTRQEVIALRAAAIDRMTGAGRIVPVEGGFDTTNRLLSFVIRPYENKRLRTLYGGYSVQGLKGLALGFSTGDSTEFQGAAEIGSHSDSISLPSGARLEGVAGYSDESGAIKALSLAYSFEAEPEVVHPGADVARGVWVPRDAGHPLEDRAGIEGTQADPFDATFGTERIYRFSTRWVGGWQKILRLHLEHGYFENGTGKRRFGLHYIDFEYAFDNEWRAVGSAGPMTDLQDRLWIERDAVRWGGSREPGARGVVMVRPPAYPDAGRDTLDWGGTFSLDHRPNGLIANFMGYNPALMKANDYAVSTGAQKRIFRMPSDDSKDYYATGSKLIVPHGLFFSLDSRGSERKDAQTIDNERERQQMKVLGLGGNVGIPLVASFSVDGSHQEAQERVYDEQVSTVHNEAIVTHYALVLDKARMPLTRAFRTEILTLRNRMISGQGISDEDWDHFFRTFGSHFAYAVTYGGKAWTETTIDSATTTSSRSFDDKISGEASGVLDEFLSVGAKANSEYSGKTLDKDATVNERTTFGTYGGSFSKGGGWSVGRGEELPVLLDLRMITELIVPVYFDDPTVYEDLRKKMQTALDSYMGGVSDALARREATWHRNHVDVPAATDPVSQCFSEGFGELCFGVVP